MEKLINNSPYVALWLLFVFLFLLFVFGVFIPMIYAQRLRAKHSEFRKKSKELITGLELLGEQSRLAKKAITELSNELNESDSIERKGMTTNIEIAENITLKYVGEGTLHRGVAMSYIVNFSYHNLVYEVVIDAQKLRSNSDKWIINIEGVPMLKEGLRKILTTTPTDKIVECLDKFDVWIKNLKSDF